MARKLNINLDSLLPGKIVEIGNVPVEIKPLGLAKLTKVVRQLRGLGPQFTEAGVTFENYSTPQSLLSIAEIIMTVAPSIMEEVADIDIDQLQEFPIDVLVDILVVVIDVNLQAKESLEKNFESLAGKLQMNKISVQ